METKKESVVNELLSLYKANKSKIKARLSEFQSISFGDDKRIFAELCFCLCTPQTKARSAWDKAIYPLMEHGLLYSGNHREIESTLKAAGVRFHRTKASNIIEARRCFKEIKERISSVNDVVELRNILAKDVCGLGMKEASHFLRNIGLGSNLAILDRHIIRNLVHYGVLEAEPKSLTKKRYLEIEEKLRDFSQRIGIPMDELDMLLWMKETGEVFK